MLRKVLLLFKKERFYVFKKQLLYKNKCTSFLFQEVFFYISKSNFILQKVLLYKIIL